MTRGPFHLPGPSRGLNIGLFGGSFNPAHEGHLHVAETAMRRMGLDWVWWVVARGNPLKESHGSYEARLSSAKRLAAHPRMRVTDIEARLGVNYTLDLLHGVKARAPDTRFVWIMGADNLSGFHRWGGWRRIAEQVPICIVARPGAGPSSRLSRFAATFSESRYDTSDAKLLPFAEAPAWTYLNAPWNPVSSTALRRAAHSRNPFRTGA